MTDRLLTLQELFEVDPQDISVRIDPQLDLRQDAQNARQEIEKASRMIRWPWVRKAVTDSSRDLLNLNVVDVLVGAWKKYMQIEQYADPKKYGPGETTLAPLVEHKVTSHHRPYVQILLKEREVARVTFDLDFSLKIEGFVLKIRDGKIWEILTGSGIGEGSLSLDDLTLWKHELKPIRFPGHISLSDGIPVRDLGLASTA